MFVVARDLLDDAHQVRSVAVTLEVTPVAAADDRARRVVRVRVGGVGVRCGQTPLLGLGHLAEDLFLGIEVVVKGPLREPGLRRDVGDACGEEPVALEHVAGGIEQAGASLHALPRPWTVLTVVDGYRAVCGRARRLCRSGLRHA